MRASLLSIGSNSAFQTQTIRPKRDATSATCAPVSYRCIYLFQLGWVHLPPAPSYLLSNPSLPLPHSQQLPPPLNRVICSQGAQEFLLSNTFCPRPRPD